VDILLENITARALITSTIVNNVTECSHFKAGVMTLVESELPIF
jgi:hypothetical protein